MILSAITGQENFQAGQCKVHLFFVPTTRFPGQEKHLGVTVRAGEHGLALASYPEILKAAPAYTDDLGKWTRASYEIPEGVVVKLFAMRTTPRRVMGNAYLHMREGAALRRITVPTTQWANGQFREVTCEGRFDVLTMAEATALGVFTPPNYAHFYARTAVDQVMDIRELSPERLPRTRNVVQTITNSAGEEVRVATTQRRRAVKL